MLIPKLNLNLEKVYVHNESLQNFHNKLIIISYGKSQCNLFLFYFEYWYIGWHVNLLCTTFVVPIEKLLKFEQICLFLWFYQSFYIFVAHIIYTYYLHVRKIFLVIKIRSTRGCHLGIGPVVIFFFQKVSLSMRTWI